VSASVTGRLMRVMLDEGDAVEAGTAVAEIDPLPLRSRVEEIEARIRALEQRIEGVDTKKPKPEEVEKAKLLVKTASESLEVAAQELAELQAALDQATSEADRMRRLRRTERVSASELEQAVTAESLARARVLAQQDRIRVRSLAIAVARLERQVLEARLSDFDWEEKLYREQAEGLKATLRSITADLSRTQIVSPIAGSVLAIHRRSEQVVQAGTPILEVADLDALEVEAEFLSEDAAHMTVGMTAEVYGRALGERVIVGRVRRIEPQAFEEVSSLGVEQQRVKVIVSFDAKDAGLGDGYRVEARVVLRVREDTTRVPEGALVREGGAWHVFRVEDDVARKVRVRPGLRDGRRREILEGLRAGDRVVVHPDDTLQDGTRVTPLPEAP
jgi:HlyD family secretion protein